MEEWWAWRRDHLKLKYTYFIWAKITEVNTCATSNDRKVGFPINNLSLLWKEKYSNFIPISVRYSELQNLKSV